MLIKRGPEIPSSEMTDEGLYVRRREFLRIAGGAAVAAAAAPLLACSSEPVGAHPLEGGQSPLTGYKEKAIATDEKLNTFDEITGYNNFYEFGTGREPQAVRRLPENQPLDREGRRPVQQAG